MGGWTVLVVAGPEGPAADVPGRLFVWPYRRSHRLCSRKEVLSSSSSAASEGIRRLRSLYADWDSDVEDEASVGGVLLGSLEAIIWLLKPQSCPGLRNEEEGLPVYG